MADAIADLLERHAAANLSWHEIGDYEFQIRTPNQFEALKTMARYESGDDHMERIVDSIEHCSGYVENWKGVTEGDIVPDAGDDPVPFDRRALAVFLADRVSVGDAIVGVIFDKIAERRALAAEEKKS